MGTEQLEALVEVIQHQLAQGTDGHVLGTWTIHYDRERNAFSFDKCEYDGYCEERPSVIAVDGTVIDRGGPIFDN